MWEPSVVVVSVWVLNGLEPIRIVTHHPDDEWSVTCGAVTTADQAVGMPLSWLEKHPDIGHFAAELALGRAVSRDSAYEPWVEEAAWDWAAQWPGLACGDNARLGRLSYCRECCATGRTPAIISGGNS